jgi:protein-S-isoprenylcysteine O-methyltransferase Ste14
MQRTEEPDTYEPKLIDNHIESFTENRVVKLFVVLAALVSFLYFLGTMVIDFLTKGFPGIASSLAGANSFFEGLYVLFEPAIDFVTFIYEAPGAVGRWVLWIWAGIILIYVILGKYDKMHNLETKKRVIKNRNYYFTLYIFGFFSALVFYLSQMEATNYFEKPILLDSLSNYVFGFALMFLGACSVIYGRFCLDGKWGLHLYTYESSPELVTDRIYKMCRHPIYFGQMLMSIGTALVLNNWIILLIAGLVILMNCTRARNEEKSLKDTHKNKWEEYRNKIPFIWPTIKYFFKKQ